MSTCRQNSDLPAMPWAWAKQALIAGTNATSVFRKNCKLHRRLKKQRVRRALSKGRQMRNLRSRSNRSALQAVAARHIVNID
jgi:hypothetical protein